MFTLRKHIFIPEAIVKLRTAVPPPIVSSTCPIRDSMKSFTRISTRLSSTFQNSSWRLK